MIRLTPRGRALLAGRPRRPTAARSSSIRTCFASAPRRASRTCSPSARSSRWPAARTRSSCSSRRRRSHARFRRGSKPTRCARASRPSRRSPRRSRRRSLKRAWCSAAAPSCRRRVSCGSTTRTSASSCARAAPTAELFVEPSPPGGLLIAPGVDVDRLSRRCRALGIEVLMDGQVVRARSIPPGGSTPPPPRTTEAPPPLERRRSSQVRIQMRKKEGE